MKILKDALLVDIIRTSNAICGGTDYQRIAIENISYPYGDEEEFEWRKDFFETVVNTYCTTGYYDTIEIIGYEMFDGTLHTITFYNGSVWELRELYGK